MSYTTLFCMTELVVADVRWKLVDTARANHVFSKVNV